VGSISSTGSSRKFCLNSRTYNIPSKIGNGHIKRKKRGRNEIPWMRDCRQENYCFQGRENITVVSMESYIEETKLRNLGSKVLIARDLESNCHLIVGEN